MCCKNIYSECKHTLSKTTNTTTYHSKLFFNIWCNVTNNLLNGFSLRRIAEENNISVLTSFRLRHKVLYALKNSAQNIKVEIRYICSFIDKNITNTLNSLKYIANQTDKEKKDK